MLSEVLAALRPTAEGRYVDATLGGGGHAAAILAASSPNGWLYGCDRDGEAVEAALQRLAEFEGRFELRQLNFAELAGWVPAGSCDGAVMDLGVSSPQLDQGARGFSFQQEGPLDMRMDRRQALTAAELVNAAGPDELAKIFWELGGERRFETTRQLAEFIERLAPRRGRKAHPATKVFQGLRIAVNDEIGALRRGLAGALMVLRPGGRL